LQVKEVLTYSIWERFHVDMRLSR